MSWWYQSNCDLWIIWFTFWLQLAVCNDFPSLILFHCEMNDAPSVSSFFFVFDDTASASNWCADLQIIFSASLCPLSLSHSFYFFLWASSPWLSTPFSLAKSHDRNFSLCVECLCMTCTTTNSHGENVNFRFKINHIVVFIVWSLPNINCTWCVFVYNNKRRSQDFVPFFSHFSFIRSIFRYLWEYMITIINTAREQTG